MIFAVFLGRSMAEGEKAAVFVKSIIGLQHEKHRFTI